jgi:Zn-dependent protease
MPNFDLTGILLSLPGVLIGLAFHEFAHALASDRLGDPTPRNQGRLTLSPVPHIDPIGLIFLIFFHFGWAKPVQTNPRYYKNPRRDDLIVSAAGPAMNLLLAFIFAGFLKIYLLFNLQSIFSETLTVYIMQIFLGVVSINILLFVFNLIPIPPLDGFHILRDFISIKNYRLIYNLERYSTIILLIFIISPLSSYILNFLINPISSFIINIFQLPSWVNMLL